MGIEAGRLRHRIRVEQQVQVKNSFGESSIEWEAIGTFWAEIRPMSSREMLIAQQTQSRVDTVIVMRYNRAITASMRGVHSELSLAGVVLEPPTIYNFSAPIRDPDSGVEWMTIPASTGINLG